MELEGKVALVVGAASGIGAATAVRVAAEGAHVLLADINDELAKQVAEGIVRGGGSASSVFADLGDPGSLGNAFAQCVSRFGGLDLLCNNAAALGPEAIGLDSDIVDIPIDSWDRTMSVNLRGTFLSCRTAIPLMLERGGGVIVNMASVAGLFGETRRVAYSASKAAIIAMTRHIAVRFAAEGIRCNAIAPGPILTETQKARSSEKRLERMRSTNPSKRFGTPEAVGSLVAYLFANDADFINGQTIAIDGGKTIALDSPR